MDGYLNRQDYTVAGPLRISAILQPPATSAARSSPHPSRGMMSGIKSSGDTQYTKTRKPTNIALNNFTISLLAGCR